MTLTQQRASFGLNAVGALTGQNVIGSGLIGVTQTTVNFSDADIIYSLRMTATGASDDAVFDLEDYGITNNTGTPTFTTADGRDFEGVTLPDTVTLYAILVTAPSTNAGKVYYEEPTGWAGESEAGSNYYSLHIVESGRAMQASLKNFALTIITSGDYLELTVIGKSS